MHIVKKQIQNRSQIKKISLKNTVRGCPQKRTTLNVALFSAYSELKSNIKHEYHNYMHLKFHYLLTFIFVIFAFYAPLSKNSSGSSQSSKLFFCKRC